MSDSNLNTIDSVTIAALRQGVDISQRIAEITVSDHAGVKHAVPLRITEAAGDNGTDVSVAVADDVLAEVAKRAIGPARRAGTVHIGALDSMIAYVKTYKGPNAVAFAAATSPGIEAVLDYHPPGDDGKARWCQDRVVYACPFSRQWRTWIGAEGKTFAQVAFGDFIEANETDLASREGFANAAAMITVARNLVINSVGKFQRTMNPTTGEGTLIVKDEHDASTSTVIPKGFALAIPVFEGAPDLYPVEARLRFAMVEGKPSFAFVLVNKETVLEHALATLRQQVAEGAGIPVFVGSAPPRVG